MRRWNDLEPKTRPWVIAHRGDSAYFPENTLAAFEGGVAAGADALELDVRLTADGHAIVFHDDELQRTTNGQGRVEDRDLAALQRLDAGSWFAPTFRSERIPTLKDVLERFGDRCALDLELKASPGETPERLDTLAREVARLVEARGTTPSILISSFSSALLAAVRRTLPATSRLLLWEDAVEREAMANEAKALDVVGLGLDVAVADAPLIDSFHDTSHAVLLFTVNEASAMRASLESGADGLFTNHVQRLRDLLGDPS